MIILTESFVTETCHNTQLLLLLHVHPINNVRFNLSSNRSPQQKIRVTISELPSLLTIQDHNRDKISKKLIRHELDKKAARAVFQQAN